MCLATAPRHVTPIVVCECSEARALADGGRERALVEIIEFAANRHAVGKLRHLDGQMSREVR